MKVVLDSNIIMGAQFHFRTAHMAAVLATAGPLHLQVVVPDVVFEEVCHLHWRELKERSDKYYESIRKLNEVLDEQIDVFAHRMTIGMSSHYRTHLMVRLGRAPFQTAPIPEVDHRQVVEAAIHKRKPFGGKNDGYRDFLIWMSVVQVAEDNPSDLPIYFVSANKYDFAANPKADVDELHPDLVRDLTERSLPEDAVKYYPSLEVFKKEVIDQRLTLLRDVSEQVSAGKFENPELYDYIPNAIAEWFFAKLRQVDVASFGLPPEVDWIEFADVDEVKEYLHAEVRSLPNDEMDINLVISALCSLQVEVDQNTRLGLEFSNGESMVGQARVTGVIKKELHFLMASLVGPAPERNLIRMDAILISEPKTKRKA